MKIKLKNTKFQYALEIIAIALVIGTYVSLIVRWSSIPDKIPAHYNFAGEINRWGNKNELLLLPILNTIFYFLLTLVQQFPSTWNIPVVITDSNRDKVYGNVKSMLILMKIEVLAIFFYLNFKLSESKPLSLYFLPVILIAIFGTTAFFLIRVFKVSKQ